MRTSTKRTDRTDSGVAGPGTAWEDVRRRVGLRAVLGGVLVAVGVELEWLLDFQEPDGTVVRPAAFALCVSVSALGFALLAWASWGLRSAAEGRSRALYTGSLLSAAGAGLLLLFSLTVLVTGLANGSPAGLSFVVFGLGMLLLSVGPVILGLGLRRRLGGVSVLLVLAGLAAFAVIAVPVDPWHDVSLVAMCAAWSGFGVLLRR